MCTHGLCTQPERDTGKSRHLRKRTKNKRSGAAWRGARGSSVGCPNPEPGSVRPDRRPGSPRTGCGGSPGAGSASPVPAGQFAQRASRGIPGDRQRHRDRGRCCLSLGKGARALVGTRPQSPSDCARGSLAVQIAYQSRLVSRSLRILSRLRRRMRARTGYDRSRLCPTVSLTPVLLSPEAALNTAFQFGARGSVIRQLSGLFPEERTRPGF